MTTSSDERSDRQTSCGAHGEQTNIITQADYIKIIVHYKYHLNIWCLSPSGGKLTVVANLTVKGDLIYLENIYYTIK